MNWKALGKTIAHAAIGGLGTGLVAIDPMAPITFNAVIMPGLVSAATSAFSALSDATLADPLSHAVIGGLPVIIWSLVTGDHVTLHSFLPGIVSGVTSAMSVKYSVQPQLGK